MTEPNVKEVTEWLCSLEFPNGQGHERLWQEDFLKSKRGAEALENIKNTPWGRFNIPDPALILM